VAESKCDIRIITGSRNIAQSRKRSSKLAENDHKLLSYCRNFNTFIGNRCCWVGLCDRLSNRKYNYGGMVHAQWKGDQKWSTTFSYRRNFNTFTGNRGRRVWISHRNYYQKHKYSAIPHVQLKIRRKWPQIAVVLPQFKHYYRKSMSLSPNLRSNFKPEVQRQDRRSNPGLVIGL